MAPQHECRHEHRLDAIETQAERVEREIYVGRDSREPLLVRVDRCERIVSWQVYVSTALLISTLLGVGAFAWNKIAGDGGRRTEDGGRMAVGGGR